MSPHRRGRLPQAAELFRATEEQPTSAVASRGQTSPRTTVSASGAELSLAGSATRRRSRLDERHPTGRERHDEKITVYCSPDELIDLEHARLALRRDYEVAVDRGRIVREAVAVVIADLEAHGENSILVRRLRGR